jgi:hypothetical protein
MTQSNRTLLYVGIAIAAVGIAYVSRPAPVAVAPTTASDSELLFPDLKDPKAAASLEIAQFDGDKLSLDEFSVAEKNDVWTIPSHEDYPADAKDQMVNTATLLSDLRITSVEPDSAEGQQRERYGLLEPTIENVQKSGAAATGMRVTLRDAAKKPLADLIIGKEVPNKTDQRYVSLPGQNRIMTIKVDTSKLSTKFKDWIETDLLKLGNVFDVAKLSLQDYSVNEEQGVFQPRAQMVFKRNDAKNAWDIASLKVPNLKEGTFVDAPPAADEELDQQKIDDMRSALNELKIVNVARKPEVLRKSLREDGSIDPESREALRSLGARGFHYVSLGGDSELLSSDGELTVTMKDGVEYVLRFGDVADYDKDGNAKPKEAAGSGSDKKPDAKEDEKAAGDDSTDEGGVNLHRFLFLVAKFNEDMIEKPEFEKLPEAPGAEQPAETPAETPAEDPTEKKPGESDPKPTGEEPPTGDKPENGEKPEGDKGDGDKPAEEKPADEKPADAAPAAEGEAKEAPKSAAISSPLRLVALQNEEPKSDEAAKLAEEEKAAEGEKSAEDAVKPTEGDEPAAPDDKPATDAEKPAVDAEKPAETPAAPPADATKPSPEDAAKQLEAERKRIEAENKAKQDDYDNKVKEAKKKVKDLNERFADWYYVIPEDVYKKIHLSRTDVIKKKGPPAGEKAPGEVNPLDLKNLPQSLGE